MGVLSLSELSKLERGLIGIPARKLNLLLDILQVEMSDVWPDDYDSPEDLATWLSVSVDELIDMVMLVTKLRR
jgi:transcriptional regulator with XRE-family HTH domain